MMDSIKKSLIPFVPPALRGLTCKSIFNLFDAIVAASKFVFTQLFFVHRRQSCLFFVWLLLWMVAIHRFEFGAMYFMISTLSFMFYNMGTRKDGTLSAYSVFNPGGFRLLGQLDASNFENEIRHRNNNIDHDDNDIVIHEMMGDETQSAVNKRVKRGNSKKARRAEAKRKKKMLQGNVASSRVAVRQQDSDGEM